MRTAIITINDSKNIGNRLQNYAVQELLKEYGSDSETVAYSVVERNYGWKSRAKSEIYSFMTYLGVLTSDFYIRYVKKSKRDSLFKEFNRRYIKLSKKYYYKRNRMAAYESDYDFYCVGSDQVWNAALVQNDGFFFLKFAPSEKTFSISASMGTTYIPEEYKQNFIDGFKHVGNISVRENDVSELIKETTGRDVTTLLDPTLLVNPEVWEKIMEKPEIALPEKYIVTYSLGGWTETQERYIREYAKQNGCEIIELNGKQKEYVGPAQFVYLIKNAEYIFTDSFHGTAFSVIFNKRFVAFQRNHMYDMSSRITNLLSIIGQDERFYSIKDNCLTSAFIGYLSELHDYDGQDILESEREKAHEFLNGCFNRGENR